MATHTIESIEADLLEYADYESVRSVPRAKLFVTAANRWLILSPQSSSNQSSSLTFDTGAVQAMLARAQRFVAANETSNGTTGNTRFLGVGVDFR